MMKLVYAGVLQTSFLMALFMKLLLKCLSLEMWNFGIALASKDSFWEIIKVEIIWNWLLYKSLIFDEIMAMQPSSIGNSELLSTDDTILWTHAFVLRYV